MGQPARRELLNIGIYELFTFFVFHNILGPIFTFLF